MVDIIKLSELREKLRNLDIDEKELRPYLIEDLSKSKPFSPAITINPKLVDKEGLEGDVAVSFFNWISKRRRQHRYRKKIKGGYSGIKIVSEGDSWFQYPLLLKDVIDHLSENYAIYSLGAAGDLLADIIAEDEITDAIKRVKPHLFLISGGGNDLLGDGMLAKVLKPFDESLKPEEYLNKQFNIMLEKLATLYQNLFKRLLRTFSGMKIITHGYDYAIPDNGPWLGKPMSKLNITKKSLQKDIIRVIIDRFNDNMKSISGEFDGTVFHVDCRGTVEDKKNWHDELHPKNEGYKKVAGLFKKYIETFTNEQWFVPRSGMALCPGRDKSIKDANDLDSDTYRKMVARRGRMILGTKVDLIKDEDIRRNVETEISEFYEKIHLGSDFLPASFLSEGTDRSNAVCRIKTPGSLGTGFLIASKNYIMTNNHVLPDFDTAESSVAEFGYEENQGLTRVTLLPDRFFVTNQTLDFTIVYCDSSRLDDVVPIPLLRTPSGVIRGERVNIIQHPRGRKKEIAIHDNKVIRVLDSVIRYSTDTEPGSSGSPVFNNTWDFVALHHAGWAGTGGKATNEGIRVASIVGHLLGRRNTDSESIKEINEILNLIPDCSPNLGFFDVEGVAEDPAEVEIPDYTGTVDFADIGFWNIEHFNNQVTNDRVDQVAGVLHRLSMDVMGLVEVENRALERLVDSLHQLGDLVNYELLDVRGRQDLAVLYDRETSSVQIDNEISDRHRDALSVTTPSGRRAFPREPLFARCRVEERNNRPIEFLMIVVHFKAFGDAQSRARRRIAAEVLVEIINDIRQHDNLPVVLGGDFNEVLTNDVLSALSDSPDLFALTADDAVSGAASYVGGRHRSLIDHIIVSRDIQPGVISGDDAAIVRLDRSVRDFADQVSDHIPIVMRLVARTAPLDVPDGPGDQQRTTVDIPDGANSVTIQFDE